MPDRQAAGSGKADIDERTALMLLCSSEEVNAADVSEMKLFAGSYTEALYVDAGMYMMNGILRSDKKAAAFRRIQTEIQARRELFRSYERSGIRMVTVLDEEYPGRLKVISNAPPVLYVKGKLPEDGVPSAGIIGARDCSEYGRYAAGFFAETLAEHGVQIISGMAAGIDSAAGMAAADKATADSSGTADSEKRNGRTPDMPAAGRRENSAGTCIVAADNNAPGTESDGDFGEPGRIGYPDDRSRTGCAAGSFAVLGNGVDICYPSSSSGLYRKLINGAGGVLSEFIPGSPPLAYHFVMRNRIIAGLSDVLLVIEARERSGTSITVNYALDQGKDIFALPGRITDPLGRGCNRLLKEGAIPLTAPEDVLELLGIGTGERTYPGKGRDLFVLSPDERRLYGSLSYDSRHIEDIAQACRMELRNTMELLYRLEKKGFAASSGRAYFRKI